MVAPPLSPATTQISAGGSARVAATTPAVAACMCSAAAPALPPMASSEASGCLHSVLAGAAISLLGVVRGRSPSAGRRRQGGLGGTLAPALSDARFVSRLDG